MFLEAKIKCPIVGWSGDEIEIRVGAEYVETMRCIVGSVEGPIAEKDIDSVDEGKLPKKSSN